METESLEDRLRTLEAKLARAERRFRLVLASLGIAILACAVSWTVIGITGRAQAQKPGETGKVIRASKFILEDENGRTRATLGVTEDGPSLGLYDETGKNRAALRVVSNGTALCVIGENGKTGATLFVGEQGPGLGLYDEDGKTRAALTVLKDGPGLVLADEMGKTVWRAP